MSCEIGNAITSWFAALARDALRPLLTLAGETLLSSPQAGAIPAVHAMWATSLAIADSAYVLLVLIGGVIVMGHETLQTSYSAKDIAPRLVAGFLAANLSLVLISRATSIANGLSAALAGDGVTPATAASALLGTLTAPLPGGGIFMVLLALAGAVLALVLAVVYVLRLMALVLLTAAAPLALAAHALPQTAWAARWWWRALTACLAIQAAQAVALTAAVRVFSSAGWLPLHGTSNGSVLPVLTALCLLYIMMRIPWWVSRPVLSAPSAPALSAAPSSSRSTPPCCPASARCCAARPGRGAPAPPRAAGAAGRPGRVEAPGHAEADRAGPLHRPAAGREPGPPPAPAQAGASRAVPDRAGASRAVPDRSGPAAGREPAAARAGPGRHRRVRAGARDPGHRRPGRAAARPGPRPQQRTRPPAQAQPGPRQPGQAPRPLPGTPPHPRAPRPGQHELPPPGVTRVPRSAAPGPRPVPTPGRPRSAWPPPDTPARPRPRPPRQLPLPPGPPTARQPGRRAAVPRPARHLPPPVPRTPGR